MDITAFLGELITLFIMAFALGMDAFSVGLGMGLIRLRLKQILTIGITIGVFHMWMPLAGMMIGHFLSDTFGAIATYVGAGLLLFLGLQMIISSFKDDDGDKRMITPVGFGLFIFALSVSLDSFSVGLSLGIYGAKTIMVILMFGVVSMILSWVGLLLGRKVQHWLGTYSEVLGGCILLVFGVKLLFPL